MSHAVRAMLCVFLCFFFIFLANPVVAKVSYNGFVQGEFSVGSTGTASYSLPIPLPPGINGLQPSLALVYDSQVKEGLLGVGWGLSGLSSISRCPVKPYNDTDSRRVNFNGSDRYCLDGQVLVPIAGANGMPGTEYRTEIESVQKIMSYGSSGNGPSFFEVHNKNGSVSQYGYNNGSNSAQNKVTIQAGARFGETPVLSWSINKVKDITGNSIQFKYATNYSGSMYHVDSIEYQNVAGVSKTVVKFQYGSNYFGKNTYMSGATKSNSKLLTGIKVLVGYQLRRQFDLRYSANSNYFSKRLTSFRECAVNVYQSQECKDALVFSYTGDALGFQAIRLSNTTICSNGSRQNGVCNDGDNYNTISYPDINGDGKPEFCFRSDTGIRCFFGNGSGFDFTSSNKIVTSICANGSRSYGICNDSDNHSYIRYPDINGDGKSDLCFRADQGIRCYLSNGKNFNTSYAITPYACANGSRAYNVCNDGDNYSSIQYPDINGDGKSDLCYRGDQGIICFKSTGYSFSVLSGWDTDICANGSRSYGVCNDGDNYSTIQYPDVNGDGKPDLCFRGDQGLRCMFNTATGLDRWGGIKTTICANGSRSYGVCNDGDNYSTISYPDLNSDGNADLCFRSDTGIRCYPSNGVSFNTSSGVITSICANGSRQYGVCNDGDNNSTIRYSDINGDGKLDLCFRGDVGIRCFVGTGERFIADVGILTGICANGSRSYNVCNDGDNYRTINYLDITGDGLTDLVYRGDQGMYLFKNRQSKKNVSLLTKVTSKSGTIDIVYKPLTDSSVYSNVNYFNYPIRSFQGSMQVVKSVTYDKGKSNANTNTYYYHGGKIHVLGRGFLGFSKITKTRSSAVSDLTTTTHTTYNQMKYNHIGSYSTNGTVNSVENLLSKPSSSLYNVPLEKTRTDWTVSYTSNNRPLPVMFQSTVTKYKYPTRAVLSTTVSGMNRDPSVCPSRSACLDNFGNMPHTITTIFEGLPGSGGKQYVTLIDSVIENDVLNWHIGKTLETTTTKRVPDERPEAAPGATLTQSLTTSFEYVPNSPKILKTTIAPKSGTSNNLPFAEKAYNLTKTTSYSYDPSYGYQNRQTVTGDAVAYNRVVSTTIDYNYATPYSHGKDVYLVTTTNVLGHASKKEIEYATGNEITHVGPNNIKNSGTGVTTLTEYDSFGRKIKETRADGNTTSWGYYTCVNPTFGYLMDANCRFGNENHYMEIISSGKPTSRRYFDQKARTVRTEVDSYEHNIVETRTIYNDQGRIKGRTKKYYRGELSYWICPIYDEVGIKVGETIPTTIDCNYSQYVTRSKSIDIDGLYTRTTVHNSTGNVIKHAWKNVVGQLIKIQDPSVRVLQKNGFIANTSPTVDYYYGANGKLIDVKDANGSRTKAQYDRRGRKVLMDDPDMGVWNYTYNALGEVKSQTDAKGQATSMYYDGLGRMYLRRMNDYDERWSYDWCSYGKGKQCITYNYNRITYQYDSINYTYYNAQGRPYLARNYIPHPDTGAWERFDVNQTYDNYGRSLLSHYPVQKNGQRFTIQRCYTDNGFLKSVRTPGTCGSTLGTTFWRLGDSAATDTVDAQGKVLDEILGANIKTTRNYSPDMDRLTDISSGIGANGQILQDNFYRYDTIGNLRERHFASKSGILSDTIEVFKYDAINRLKTATVYNPGLPSFTKRYEYDAVGNIMYRSDFGSVYEYDPVQVHAVTKVHNGNPYKPVASYAYDDNGFMTNNNGQIIDPTSFGKPRSITGNGVTTEFRYDTSHMRVSQSKAGLRTVYLNPRIDIGGHYEKVTDTSGTNTVVTHKHYIYGGSGVISVHEKKETTTPSNTTSYASKTNYFLKDHLGSIEVVLNANGTQKERFRYDAFGKRLTLGDIHHGFTGHEHLEEYGIIHMNGRLYNPDLGRFMAADPKVKFAHSTQGFNRFSYTDNNPLSRVDLDGYGWLSKTWKKYKKAIITIAVVALAAYTGGAAYAAFMSSQAGAAMAIAGYSGSAIMAAAGAVAGAASGAVIGAASGYAKTGNLRGALKGAAIGGAAGAIGGAIGGYTSSSLTGRMLNGGLNGAMQTGDSEGFARGMIAGAIPTDLGMTSTYLDSAIGNAAISVVRDGIRGGIIDGKEGAERGIKMGLATNVVGHLHGYVMQKGWGAPKFEVGTGTFRYNVTSVFGSSATPAITFGNVVSYNTGTYSLGTLASVQAHELEHAHQQSALGASYLPLHAASQWSGSHFLEHEPYKFVDPY